MAVAGDFINKTNLANNGSSTENFIVSGDYCEGLTSDNGSSYVYICSCRFSFRFKGNYWFFGSPTHVVNIQHWDGSKWVTDISKSLKNAEHNFGTFYGGWVWRIRIDTSGGAAYRYCGEGWLHNYATGDMSDTYWTQMAQNKMIVRRGSKWYKVYGAGNKVTQAASVNDYKPDNTKLDDLYRGGDSYRGSAIPYNIGKSIILPALKADYTWS